MERKLDTIVDQARAMESRLQQCASQEGQQPILEELAYLKTKKMLYQRHRGALLHQLRQLKDAEDAQARWRSITAALLSRVGALMTGASLGRDSEAAPFHEYAKVDASDSVHVAGRGPGATSRPTLRKRNASTGS